MIKIVHGNDSKEIRYIFDTILSSIGYFYEYVEKIPDYEDRNNIYIIYEQKWINSLNCNIITIYKSSDEINKIYSTGWIDLKFIEEKIPIFYERIKNLSNMPIFKYENGDIAVAKTNNNGFLNINIGFDFIKIILFFLTRTEEIEHINNDKLGRFSASQSIISQYNLKEKPIIDVYLIFIRYILSIIVNNNHVALIRKELWPGGKKFAVCLTHDVDKVYFKAFYGFAFGIIQIIKNLFLFDFKSAKKAYKKCKRMAFAKNDPYWNFKKWVELERQFGYRSTFFFLARKRRFLFKHKDLRYSLNQPKVVNAINYLQQEGWDIGLYGDVDSFLDTQKLKKEKIRLENLVNSEILGVRQHYFRIKLPQTQHVQQDAGFLYDSTLGWHDSIGFRCAMSYPFYFFNISTKKKLKILEIPIGIEEPILFKSKQILHSKSTATETAIKIFKTAKKLGSLINLLWCQPSLDDVDYPDRGEVYKVLLNYLKNNDVFVGTAKDILEWWKGREDVKLVSEKINENGKTWELETMRDIYDLSLEIACEQDYKIRISKDIDFTLKKNLIQFKHLKKGQKLILSLLF